MISFSCSNDNCGATAGSVNVFLVCVLFRTNAKFGSHIVHF